jgi:hypothetical protein
MIRMQPLPAFFSGSTRWPLLSASCACSWGAAGVFFFFAPEMRVVAFHMFFNIHRLLPHPPPSPNLTTASSNRYFDPTLTNPCVGGDLNVRMEKKPDSASRWDYIRYLSQCDRTPSGSVCCNSNCSSGAECIFLPVSAYPIVIAGWVFTSICILITCCFIASFIQKSNRDNNG